MRPDRRPFTPWAARRHALLRLRERVDIDMDGRDLDAIEGQIATGQCAILRSDEEAALVAVVYRQQRPPWREFVVRAIWSLANRRVKTFLGQAEADEAMRSTVERWRDRRRRRHQASDLEASRHRSD